MARTLKGLCVQAKRECSLLASSDVECYTISREDLLAGLSKHVHAHTDPHRCSHMQRHMHVCVCFLMHARPPGCLPARPQAHTRAHMSHADMSLCVRPCMHVRAYVHTHERTHIHTYIHSHAHMYICTYMRTYVHTHTHARARARAHTHTCMHACVRTYLRAYVRTCMHAYMCAYKGCRTCQSSLM